MRHFFLVLIGALVGQCAFAQGNDRLEVETHLEYLRLEDAARASLKLPAAKEQPFYQSRILFLKFLATEDPEVLPIFLDHSKASLKKLDKLDDGDPERNVMMAELFFLRGVAKMLDKKLVSSAIDIKSACTLIDKNLAKFPDNHEQKKLLGMFHVAMSAIPKKLRWLSNALCFRGDLDTGLALLEEAAEKSKLLPSEAHIGLFYFEKNLLAQPEKALARVEKLLAAKPKSIVYAYLKLSALLEERRIDNALAFCAAQEASLMDKQGRSPLPLWHYSRAKAHYFKLEYKEAIRHFDLFLSIYKGKTLYSDALFRKGMSLVLMDRYGEARKIFHQMSSVESSTFDEDEYASHMAAIYRFREPSEEEKDLFRARNLFDGGYYGRSLAILDSMALRERKLEENYRTELFYRLGRNQHALDKLDLARENYEKCIGTVPGMALWMKVYAHYYLGKVEETVGNIDAARDWYEKALEFDGYEYQAGLEQRTKAAIHRIKNTKSAP